MAKLGRGNNIAPAILLLSEAKKEQTKRWERNVQSTRPTRSNVVRNMEVAVMALVLGGVGIGAPAQSLASPPINSLALSDPSARPLPKAVRDLGYLSAAVCALGDDASANRAAALAQLRAQAASKGADAIMDLRFVPNSNARSSCWHRGLVATGEAVARR